MSWPGFGITSDSACSEGRSGQRFYLSWKLFIQNKPHLRREWLPFEIVVDSLPPASPLSSTPPQSFSSWQLYPQPWHQFFTSSNIMQMWTFSNIFLFFFFSALISFSSWALKTRICCTWSVQCSNIAILQYCSIANWLRLCKKSKGTSSSYKINHFKGHGGRVICWQIISFISVLERSPFTK